MCSPDVPCTGWSVVARLHYGEDLSDYVGFSVAVFDLDLDALAKATSILVFVGVGSYVAYRVLLGTLNTVDLLQAFFFYIETQWYSSEKSDTSEYEVNGNSLHLSGEAQPTVVKVISSNCSSVESEALAGGKNGANVNCNLTVAARPEQNDSSNVAQPLTLSCHSSPLRSRHFRSCSRNSSVSFLNDSSGSCLSSTPFLWDYEWAASADHPPSIAKRRSISSGLSPRKRALLSSNGLCSYSDFSSDHSQVYSRDPSEWSEIVESKLVGESTIAQFDQLQGDIVELRSEMETFKSDCDRYMVDRRTTLGDLKSMYRSVPAASSHSGSSLPDVECPSPSSSSTNMIMMASCDSVCTCRPSSSSVLCPSCGTQIPTSRCRGCSTDVGMPSAIQDSYHSFISTDLVPSVCSTSGAVAAMSASFIDSCISSSDDNCLAGLVCTSSAAGGRLPMVKSLDVEHACHSSPASWILVDLNDFLCKHMTDSLKLSHVTCQLIHKRAMQQVFVLFASQLNIVQAILYHMCLARKRPLADAFASSIRGFMTWFAQCDLPEGVLTASCMQSLAATESWLGQMEHEEVESGVRNFEANLSLYETALKVLIAWNVLIRHSSIVSEEESDSSHGILCDQSETISIFVNTLQKSAEDFSYTEIASLAKILNVTLEVFELYADLPRLLVRYPNVQSANGGSDNDYSRCLPLLSVVPCNYFPIL